MNTETKVTTGATEITGATATTHDIELPPIPKGDIAADTCPVIWVHSNAQLQAYARAAIEADRKRRGEPVLVGWAVGTTGGGLLHASKYTEYEARRAGYSLPLYRLTAQQPLSESDIPAEPVNHSFQDCPEVDKWNCKYCKRVNSCPVQGHQDAQPTESVSRDVEALVRLLEDGEWAEHVARTPLGQRLELAITTLVGEASKPHNEPVSKTDWNNELSSWGDEDFIHIFHERPDLANRLRKILAEPVKSTCKECNGTGVESTRFHGVWPNGEECLEPIKCDQCAGFGTTSAAESVKCIGCEGKPAPENNPCAVCGKEAESVAAEFPVKGKLHGPLGGIATTTNPDPVKDSVDIDDFIAAFIARGDITKDAFLEARQWVRNTYYNPAESVNMDLVRKWQAENGVKQDPDSREARMVVIRHDDDGKPTVWCDPEIADLVRALNNGGLATVGSCSGHGWRPGNIMLSDGRVLIICKDVDEAKGVVSHFPCINGEAPLDAEAVGGMSAGQLAEILTAYIKPEIIGEALEKLENAPWELSEPGKPFLTVKYDDKGDYLYICCDSNEAAEAEENEQGILLWRAHSDGRLVGVTIPNFIGPYIKPVKVDAEASVPSDDEIIELRSEFDWREHYGNIRFARALLARYK